MTMFEELFALAASATLTMTVSADEKTGRMTINIIPKPKKDVDEPALSQALSLSATPQEFDAGFVQALQGYRAARLSLAQQAEATKEVLEAAQAASVKKAGDATAKAAARKPAPVAMAAASAAAANRPHDAEDDEEGKGPEAAAPAQPGSDGTATFDLFG